MFDHCIHVMSTEQSDVVTDLMEKGPSPNCYNELKAAYIERRTPSIADREQRLRTLGPLTDQRPTDLLRLKERITGRSLQGDDNRVTGEFIRRLLMQTRFIIRPQTDILTADQLPKIASVII